ncbi:hypothetical protein JCGZ_06797 [Jatropha curcas]|uniref:NAC transcription factor 039 n=1 Tax=Jatropha curcas TaxID=180498 RepID=R4NHM9_JATCU|nr:NAC domain-containing protein 90 [Jatropha curcas]AGL39695.1 NAC transcription factor 039 [Jatropha curcas]KDP37343.1 hypothetical protein JCGZ_06797 [Jatropha curcas]
MENFAPGIRFYPTEEELLSFYLHHRLEAKQEDLIRVMDRVIPVLYIYEFSPWQLPQFSGVYSRRDPEQWFFFIPRQESEARGGRPNRLTTDGYWKATGCPGYVYSSNNRCVGVKRTMVFYKGRAPRGRKTEWKMNEYKAIDREASSSSTGASLSLRHEFSLCRVYKKAKCLRSFDRRPVGMETRQLMVHGDEVARPSTHPKRKRSSAESSSLGGHGYPSQETGQQSNNNIPMAVIHNEPLWDWDQLKDWRDYGGLGL